jgi:hypothetical protein
MAFTVAVNRTSTTPDRHDPGTRIVVVAPETSVYPPPCTARPLVTTVV